MYFVEYKSNWRGSKEMLKWIISWWVLNIHWTITKTSIDWQQQIFWISGMLLDEPSQTYNTQPNLTMPLHYCALLSTKLLRYSDQVCALMSHKCCFTLDTQRAMHFVNSHKDYNQATKWLLAHQQWVQKKRKWVITCGYLFMNSTWNILGDWKGSIHDKSI